MRSIEPGISRFRFVAARRPGMTGHVRTPSRSSTASRAARRGWRGRAMR
jgi:hypothetical protein